MIKNINEKINMKKIKPPVLDEDTVLYLKDIFKEDVDNLIKAFDIDVSLWFNYNDY